MLRKPARGGWTEVAYISSVESGTEPSPPPPPLSQGLQRPLKAFRLWLLRHQDHERTHPRQPPRPTPQDSSRGRPRRMARQHHTSSMRNPMSMARSDSESSSKHGGENSPNSPPEPRKTFRKAAFSLPEAQRRRLSTSNACEALHSQIRRRTRVVGSSPARSDSNAL